MSGEGIQGAWLTGMILFESFCLFIVLPLMFLDQAKEGFVQQAHNFIDKSCLDFCMYNFNSNFNIKTQRKAKIEKCQNRRDGRNL